MLGGGIAFLAVSEAERTQGATSPRHSGRGTRSPDPDETDEADPTTTDGVVDDAAGADDEVTDDPAPSDDTVPVPAPTGAIPAVVGADPPTTPLPAVAVPDDTEQRRPPTRAETRRRHVLGPPRGQWGDAPQNRTAIEGPYRKVARSPWYRKIMAVVGIVVIVGALSLGVAAVIGLVAAVVAELLDQAF